MSSISSSTPVLTSVREYLGGKNLNIPEEPQRGCLHRHLETQRSFLLTSPVSRISLIAPHVALCLSSSVAHKLGLETLSQKALHADDLLINYMTTQIKPLVRTMNMPQQRDLTSSETGGICAGASLYFNFLYEKNAPSSSNSQKTRDLLIKAARLFVQGGVQDAVELHRAIGDGPCVDLMCQQAGDHLLTLVPNDDTSCLEKGTVFYKNQNEIKNLANGPHLVKIDNGSGYHAMSLIKLSENHCFIFDPARGLFEFAGQDISDEIIQFLNTEYRRAHKYIYLQTLRRFVAIRDNTPIKPSNLKEMYVQIFPTCIDSNLPLFHQTDLTDITEQRTRSLNQYQIGFLQYLWGALADSMKASL